MQILGFHPNYDSKYYPNFHQIFDPLCRDNRVFQHIAGALTLSDEEKETDSEKLKTIHQIHAAGLEVIHVIHRHNMDEKTAFEVEAALIDATPGLTNIQGGTHSNDYGPMHVDELERLYKAEILDVGEERCLLIKVRQDIFEDRGLYEATRYCWKLSRARLDGVKYVIATINGIVREVYSPTSWYPVENRWAFNGTVAQDQSSWKYKRIPDQYRKKGMASPCLHLNV